MAPMSIPRPPKVCNIILVQVITGKVFPETPTAISIFLVYLRVLVFELKSPHEKCCMHNKYSNHDQFAGRDIASFACCRAS